MAGSQNIRRNVFDHWLGGADYLPWAHHRAGFTSLLLFALGGIVFTVGAILFYLQRPQLRPHVFGYHEVWHVFTVVAVALQFAGVGVLIARVG